MRSKLSELYVPRFFTSMGGRTFPTHVNCFSGLCKRDGVTNDFFLARFAIEHQPDKCNPIDELASLSGKVGSVSGVKINVNLTWEIVNLIRKLRSNGTTADWYSTERIQHGVSRNNSLNSPALGPAHVSAVAAYLTQSDLVHGAQLSPAAFPGTKK